MSTEKIYTAVVSVANRRLETKCQGKISYLDVGAGRGELISMMEKTFGVQAQACDYHIDRFPHKNIPIEQVNLNVDGLPYEDNSFDLVTCSEVLEHVENYRQTTRDIWRVLKPGGVAIFTTPNVLNMNSRIRYLVSGFCNLFGPLPIKNDKLYSTGGHITPIPYFYLSHALTDANFASIELDIDKRQRSSSIKAIIVSPFILIGKVLFWKSESKKYQTITAENMPLVKAHFTWDILTARTIVVSARKDA